MEWLDDFWNWADASPSRTEIVGGLAVALIVAVATLITTIARKSWRDKIWGNVGRLFKWFWRSRPITVRRHTAELASVVRLMGNQNEAQARLIATQVVRDEAISKAKLDGAISELAKQMARIESTNASASPDVPFLLPAPPPPNPRLKMINGGSKDGRHTFRLVNLMPGSVMLNTRIEISPKGAFLFDDAAFWPEFSGEREGTFKGQVTDYGRKKGYTIYVHWLDQDHDNQSDRWTVAATSEPDPWDTDQVPF